MDQLYEIAFAYYHCFFSIRGKIGKLKIQIILTIISAALFIYCLVDYLTPIGQVKLNGWVTLLDMKLIFFAEIVFLTSLTHLQEERDNLAIKGFSHYSKKNKIILAKRNWIRINCNVHHEEYFDFAEKIIKLKNHSKEFQIKTITKEKKITEYFYSSDSKARITSYIIFMLSMIFILSAKDVASLSEILPYLEDSSYINFVKKLMLLAVLIFIISIGVIQLTRIFIAIADSKISQILTKKKGTDRFINIFISELIKMHRLPPITIKTNDL